MSNMQIDAVLAQIRSMQSQVRGTGGPPSEISQAAAGVGGLIWARRTAACFPARPA